VTADEALAAVLATLEQIQALMPADMAAWDTDERTRLAVERLWISAGDAAEEYRRGARLETGVEPWAELAAYRNRVAHALPGDVSPERVWADTTADLPRIISEVRFLLT